MGRMAASGGLFTAVPGPVRDGCKLKNRLFLEFICGLLLAAAARPPTACSGNAADGLSVGVHHIIVKADSGFLQFEEYLQLINSSGGPVGPDKTHRSGRAFTFECRLPEGFERFSGSAHMDAASLVWTPHGFLYVREVPPGEHRMTFSYAVEISSKDMDIEKRFSLPTRDVAVFTQLGAVEVKGLGGGGEFVSRDGAAMRYFSLGGFEPSQKVSLRFSGFNAPNLLDPAAAAALCWATASLAAMAMLSRSGLRGTHRDS